MKKGKNSGSVEMWRRGRKKGEKRGNGGKKIKV